MNDSYKIVNGTEIFNKSINSTVESSFSEDTWSFVPLIMAIFDLVGIICVLYFKYKYRKKIIKKEICPICLQNFYNIHITLNCKHRFHLSCLKMWQLVKPICPTCKRSIKR
jgi:formate dehydrogenase maturation protein FdhE